MILRDRYALLPAAGLAPATLAGWQKAVCTIAVAPALGARYSQFQALLGADGQCAGNTGRNVYLIYVVEGNASVLLDERRTRLEAGHLVVVPADKDLLFNATSSSARVLVTQRKALPNTRFGPTIVHEREVKPRETPTLPGVKVQVLLPEEVGAGIVAELWTIQPGASLSGVGSSVMEAGWFMLQGEGIGRVGEDYFPVEMHDTIWLAPFCPNWFGALGRSPSVMFSVREANPDPV